LDKTYIQYLRCCFLNSPLKILLCGYLTKKYTSIPCEKKPHSEILSIELKE